MVQVESGEITGRRGTSDRVSVERLSQRSDVHPKRINLMSELYSGTESAVRRGDTISDLFPVATGVGQR